MQKFSTSFGGYNKYEVNKFVSDVTKNYEDVLNKLKSADQEVERLQQELVKYKNLENTLNRAIMVANDTANQVRRSSRNEAEAIINEARRNASRIVNDALIRSERIELKADMLERNVRIFKKKLKLVVEQQLAVVEEIEVLEIDS